MQVKHALTGRPPVGLQQANALRAQHLNLGACNQSRRLEDFPAGVGVKLQEVTHPLPRHHQNVTRRSGPGVEEGDDGGSFVNDQRRLPALDNVRKTPVSGDAIPEVGQVSEEAGGEFAKSGQEHHSKRERTGEAGACRGTKVALLFQFP